MKTKKRTQIKSFFHSSSGRVGMNDKREGITKGSLILLGALLVMAFAYQASAQTDILAEGGVWNHPKATISGVGQLRFEDDLGFQLKFKGLIECDVEASASADPDNDVKIEGDALAASAVAAESKNASITVNNCSVNGGGIPNSTRLTAAEVMIEISGYDPAAETFDKYGAGGSSSGAAPWSIVDLKIGKGTITAVTCKCDTIADSAHEHEVVHSNVESVLGAVPPSIGSFSASKEYADDENQIIPPGFDPVMNYQVIFSPASCGIHNDIFGVFELLTPTELNDCVTSWGLF